MASCTSSPHSGAFCSCSSNVLFFVNRSRITSLSSAWCCRMRWRSISSEWWRAVRPLSSLVSSAIRASTLVTHFCSSAVASSRSFSAASSCRWSRSASLRDLPSSSIVLLTTFKRSSWLASRAAASVSWWACCRARSSCWVWLSLRRSDLRVVSEMTSLCAAARSSAAVTSIIFSSAAWSVSSTASGRSRVSCRSCCLTSHSRMCVSKSCCCNCRSRANTSSSIFST
mmetsp:Transcript_22222/g.42394  ORF Transcript_22222/g.42394 Transcript_22222/m.42394 type:complete len:227 (+) Transcript_22222:4256-4936(+)